MKLSTSLLPTSLAALLPLARLRANLSAGERRFVQIAAFAVTLTLIFLIGIEPALQGRQRLTKTLPTLRHQAAELAGLAATQGSISTRTAPADFSATLKATLRAAGLDSQANSTLDEANDFRVVLKAVHYEHFLRWLQDFQKVTRQQIATAKITAVGAGKVDIDLVFSP